VTIELLFIEKIEIGEHRIKHNNTVVIMFPGRWWHKPDAKDGKKDYSTEYPTYFVMFSIAHRLSMLKRQHFGCPGLALLLQP
jgi:hypothetical protein